MKVGSMNICKEKMQGQSEDKKYMEQFPEVDILGKAL